MIALRMTTNVPDNRRVVLTLPPEVPTGPAELVVTLESPTDSVRNPGACRPRRFAASELVRVNRRTTRRWRSGYRSGGGKSTEDEQGGRGSNREPHPFSVRSDNLVLVVPTLCVAPPSGVLQTTITPVEAVAKAI